MADHNDLIVVYVDEAQGSDLTGNGSIDAPFQSAVAGLTAAGLHAIVHSRKTPNDTYEPLGTSALKKAKKTVEINEKKARKADELKAKANAENAERSAKEAKRIEDSKNIVLEEDPSLPPAIKASVQAIVRV
jgi:asparaginyl-tRNA synthetase